MNTRYKRVTTLPHIHEIFRTSKRIQNILMPYFIYSILYSVTLVMTLEYAFKVTKSNRGNLDTTRQNKGDRVLVSYSYVAMWFVPIF